MYNTGDISSMINKIISDPSFAEMIGGMKGTESGKTAEEMSRDIASKLPDVMAMLAPMLSSSGDGKKETDNIDPPGEAGNKESASKSSSGKSDMVSKKYDKAHAEKLLYAIKPYLSRNRCEIIDKCVSVMQITDVVNAFGGLEGLLKIGEK